MDSIKYVTNLQNSKKWFNTVPCGAAHVNYHRKSMHLHIIAATITQNKHITKQHVTYVITDVPTCFWV